jgi:hypothetical protein
LLSGYFKGRLLYSRRTFLKVFGVAVVGVSLPISRSVFGYSVSPESQQGRAFESLLVVSHPDVDADVVDRLWPDSVFPIAESRQPDWYRVPGGFVPRMGVQPMLPYEPDDDALPASPPFWAEVAGPSVSVRTYCGADAALVTRIGHGGVVKVMDTLPGEPNGWYGIEDGQGAFLGWTQANRWLPVNTESSGSSFPDRVLQIDRQTNQIMAVDRGKVALQADCSIGQSITAGRTVVQGFQRGGAVSTAGGLFHAVPWQVHFSDHFMLAGAYWHNRFGEPVNGLTVQLPPLLAHWVYAWLGENSTIVVV